MLDNFILELRKHLFVKLLYSVTVFSYYILWIYVTRKIELINEVFLFVCYFCISFVSWQIYFVYKRQYWIPILPIPIFFLYIQSDTNSSMHSNESINFIFFIIFYLLIFWIFYTPKMKS